LEIARREAVFVRPRFLVWNLQDAEGPGYLEDFVTGNQIDFPDCITRDAIMAGLLATGPQMPAVKMPPSYKQRR
jgi:hypothetical protein